MEQAQEKYILVVEDEPDVQIVLKTALQDAGFNVATASDGHQAYNSVKENKPDLITLDLVMPRQSGVLFYKKLRKNSKWSKIPVMIISAHAKDDLGQEDFAELMKAKEFPAPDGYLEKPVNTSELVGKAAELLGIDASLYLEDAADDKRADILDKLRSVDLGTLNRVRNILDKQ